MSVTASLPKRGRRDPGSRGSADWPDRATALLVSILYRELGATIAVVSPGEAETLKDDLESLVGEDEVLFFPDWEILPYDEFSPHEAIVGTRLRTLAAARGRPQGDRGDPAAGLPARP